MLWYQPHENNRLKRYYNCLLFKQMLDLVIFKPFNKFFLSIASLPFKDMIKICVDSKF